MARAGRVTLIGRPNAGKSTLLNRLLGEKLAIVSDKPQTTRTRMVGILSGDRGQIVFFDTPGVHRPLHRMNREMMRVAEEALQEADLVCLLVDASSPFGRGDAYLLELVARARAPRIAVLNKIDLVAKPRLLPLMERYGAGRQFAEIVPVSALDGDGCDRLLDCLWRHLPEGEPLYDPELLTIHPERFLVAERIREKLLELTRNEIPFTSAVLLESWEEESPPPGLLRLGAVVLVESESQKRIVVGRQGAMIRAIGTAARLDLEEYLGRKVFLGLHVRCEPGWRENPRHLTALGRDSGL
ncbi:MAG: GTPase Era [Acidobacteria bacterium]|jgi:GTP-binding protein Era|nr:GTPase Era [Thermoanaerobaculia bacterium]MDI9631912.1 GTPase Era [Acidobacteriota bacterium]OQC35205.1 MAG: GTPase Era [Acidobacteria bacterium ADurb.Bin051]MBP7812091.1 GTPase Era [Thermoanaerobaculia bacterium]MBP8846483.1 GTPase Era [Thermoanaerobaculia bacterium]